MGRSSFPALVGMAEVGEMRGVSASTASNWRARFADFPVPVANLRCGSIFLLTEVQKFLDAHPNLGAGSPRAVISEQTRDGIRSAISGGQDNVSALARDFGVSRSSVYDIAADLLFA